MADSLPKKILCFGDSNTYGYKPNANPSIFPDERYAENERWTGILQRLLGSEYTIIEDGVNGRTTDITGKLTGDAEKNGLISFVRIYPKHVPLGILVLQLGTNDLKERFQRSAPDIAQGIDRIVHSAIKLNRELAIAVPQIIIISPSLIDESLIRSPYRMRGATQKSQQLGEYYSQIALKYACQLLDLAQFVTASQVDGLHLDLESHQLIARQLEKLIREE